MPARVLDERERREPPADAEALRALCGRALDLAGLGRCAFGMVLVDDARMSEYNRQYRGKEGPTNVLSFPASRPDVSEFSGDAPAGLAALQADLGDVIVSVDTARREAEAGNMPLERRLAELMIHGLLHLAGYDHERSEAEALVMWDREQEILARLFARRRNAAAPRLRVHVDPVAALRRMGGGAEPDPVLAAGVCELAGARGIAARLWEDRRHIQDRDARLLRQTVRTHFNLAIAASKELLDFALDLRPGRVTLVPEKRREQTSEGGLDAAGRRRNLALALRVLDEAGIEAALYVDPEPGQIAAAAELGAGRVELQTGRYAGAASAAGRERELARLRLAVELALEQGLRVNVGGGLNYRNVGPVAAIAGIAELGIGHALVSRAAFAGLDAAVREMLAAIREGAAQAERQPGSPEET